MDKQKKALIVFWVIIIVGIICGGVIVHRSNVQSKKLISESKARMAAFEKEKAANLPKLTHCDYCGGEYICAVCGEEGLYCERSSWGGNSTDHFCSKHWADCCEWHEKQNGK